MMPAENSEALFGEIPGRFVVLEHRVPRAFVRQEEIASSESSWVADASRVIFEVALFGHLLCCCELQWGEPRRHEGTRSSTKSGKNKQKTIKQPPENLT
jgi:hypothetical protein